MTGPGTDPIRWLLAGMLAVGTGASMPTPALSALALPAPPSSAGGSIRAPAFAFSARPLSRPEQQRMVGVTWRPGCPVPLRDLRRVTMSHWGFDGKVRSGTLVVHARAVPATRAAFRALFAQRFPIRAMVPIEAYRGDDFVSIEADNTSAFNCRPATGSRHWSRHAYGLAVDINPLENPYVVRGRTSHAGSVRYLDRRRYRTGMLLAGSPAVRAFDRAGWAWGGRWRSPKDYQHFAR